jgi:hypothetical protein
MTPTVAVPAMLNFQVRGQWVTRQIMFIGIDEATHAGVSEAQWAARATQDTQRTSPIRGSLKEYGV